MSFTVGTLLSLVSDTFEFTPTTGLVEQRVYEGTRDAVIGVASIFARDPVASRFYTWSTDDSQAPKWRITIRSPGFSTDTTSVSTGDNVVTSWELLGNQNDRPAWDHPKLLALDDETRANIRKALKYEAGDANYYNPNQFTGDAATAYALLANGQDSFEESQYVIRATLTAASNTDLLIAYTGVNKLWTTEQLSTPGIVQISIPAPIIFQIANIPAPTAQTGYLWSWLKKTPTMTQFGATRYQITQEWWLSLYSTFYYTAHA